LLIDQTWVRAFAADGDSGAPVFRRDSPSSATLYGILSGGDVEDNVFSFSPMSGIEYELGRLTVFTDAPTGTAATPDLVAEPLPQVSGRERFCRLGPKGELIVQVRNQGYTRANPTTTSVVFFPGGDVSRATPSVPAGASESEHFNIPSRCFNPRCDFMITVDASLDVWESLGDEVDERETNNIQLGQCPGKAG
jgi:hypothetical protein